MRPKLNRPPRSFSGSVIIACYTAHSLGDTLSDLHRYFEHVAARPVWTEELEDQDFWLGLRDWMRPDVDQVAEWVKGIVDNVDHYAALRSALEAEPFDRERWRMLAPEYTRLGPLLNRALFVSHLAGQRSEGRAPTIEQVIDQARGRAKCGTAMDDHAPVILFEERRNRRREP